MGNLVFEQERARIDGDNISTTVGEFNGSVRSLENQGLELGDTWTFPKDGYQVCTTKVGDTDGIEYIWIELENGNAKKFFPSTFTKSRGLYELDEKDRPKPIQNADNTPKRKKTEGTATEIFRSKASINEAMNALAGKRVTVSNVETVKTLNFRDSSKLVNTQFYTIDLAPKK